MESVIQRVAKSQCEFDGRPWLSMPKGERERYKERAVLAIKAMREPTGYMVDAARDQHEGEHYLPYSLFGAMIDAALEEK